MIVILSASYAAQKFGVKSLMLILFMLPALAGLVILYVEANGTNFQQGPALAGYYLLAFIFGGNPLIVRQCCFAAFIALK